MDSKKHRAFVYLLSALLAFLGCVPAHADSNQLITYQGRVLRPDKTPLEGNIVFNVKIYSPAPSTCLLWAESQTLEILGSAGAFSLQIGRNGNRLTGANGGGVATFNQVFLNNPAMVINSPQCDSGNSYTPSLADDRTLRVTFTDKGQQIKVVDLPIKSVPFAMQAEQIGGYSVNYLFKIAGMAQAGDKAVGLFARPSMDHLWELSHNQDFQGKVLKNLGTPTTGSDAATKAYVDSIAMGEATPGISEITVNAPLLIASSGNSRSISLGTTGTAGTYGSEILVPQITVDAWGRINLVTEKAIPLASSSGAGLVSVDTSSGLSINSGTLSLKLVNLNGANFGSQAERTVLVGPATGSGIPSFRLLQESDIPTLTAAGKVENSATTATSTNTPTAIITRDNNGSFNANNATLNSVTIGNGFASTVILKTPAALTSYTLTLPQNQGSADDILSVDAMGNLAWKSLSASGAVNLVDLALPSELSVTSPPITAGGGTLSAVWSTQNQNLIFASPAGAVGVPSFRTIDPLDIPALDISKLTTGTLTVDRGGTGLSSLTPNALIMANGTGNAMISKTCAAGEVLVWQIGIGWVCEGKATGAMDLVDIAVPSIFGIAGGPITSSGTFDITLNNQNQNMVFAAPTGGAGTPSFRGLEASDIPSLDISKLTSGILSANRGGTGLAPALGDANKIYGINGAGDNGEYKSLIAGSGVSVDLSTPGQISISATGLSGPVFNIGAIVPAYMTVSPAAITSSGTFDFSFNSQGVSMVFASPTGASGAPTFRTLSASDIPPLDASKITSGTLPVHLGGTGLGIFSPNALLMANNTGSAIINKTCSTGEILIWQPDIGWDCDSKNTGSVTSVDLAVPSIFSVTGGPITSQGSFNVTLNSQTQNSVFAAPTTGNGAPTFRTLAASDIPFLDASQISSGTLSVSRGGTGINASTATNGQLLIGHGSGFSLNTLTAGPGINLVNTAGSIEISSSLAGGAVTNIGLTAPTSIFTIANSPVTGAGTMAMSLSSQSAALVFASPTGATGAPTFRSLAATDIPSLDWSKITTGKPTTLAGYGITDGGSVAGVTAGTGLTGGTVTTNGTIGLGAELAALNALTTTGFVKRTGPGNYITSTSLNLTTDVTGILPIANGGTNSGTALSNNRLMASVGGAIKEMAAMTDGQIVVGKTGAAPLIASLSGDATISNAGALTLSTGAVNSAKILDGSVGVVDLDFAGTMATNTGIIVRNGSQFYNMSCAGNQTLIWNVANGWICTDFTLTETDPKVGTNTTNYLSKWNGSALVTSGVFESTGKVGIGTNAPAYNLDVTGSMGVSGTFYSTVTTTGSAVTYLGYEDTTNRGMYIVNYGSEHATSPSRSIIYGNYNGGTSSAGGYIDFNTPNNYIRVLPPGGTLGVLSLYSGGTSTMQLDAAGNVGIGTTAPVTPLDVKGQIRSRVYSAGSSTSIDWNQGNLVYTSASCGAFTFSNMLEGGSYTLIVMGSTMGTCTFSQTSPDTLTAAKFRFVPENGNTSPTKMTLYNFVRAGGFVFVNWSSGY